MKNINAIFETGLLKELECVMIKKGGYIPNNLTFWKTGWVDGELLVNYSGSFVRENLSAFGHGIAIVSPELDSTYWYYI